MESIVKVNANTPASRLWRAGDKLKEAGRCPVGLFLLKSAAPVGKPLLVYVVIPTESSSQPVDQVLCLQL